MIARAFAPAARGPAVGARLASLALLLAVGAGCDRAPEATPDAAATVAEAAAEATRPWRPKRVFLFVVDTLRRDHVSAYGSPVPTPQIDRLAANGQLFRNVTASFHQTTMSMGALFSGRTPSIETGADAPEMPWTGSTWCGLGRFAEPGEQACVPRSVTTLAERFQQAGYWTIGVTANRLLFDPYGYSQGFDAWAEIGARRGGKRFAHLRRARHLDPRALALIDERPRERFFFYGHWLDVHDYWSYPATYREAVAIFDRGFGTFLDALGERGLFEDALIVFTSDHGESLREPTAIRVANNHVGNPAFEAQLRIPLIVSPPTRFDPDAFLRTQDVHDLILRAAGIEPQPVPQELHRDELYLGELWYQTYRRGRWKSTRKRKDHRPYLFDLENDPGETRDVAAEHPEIVARHARRVEALARALATRVEAGRELTEEDREALRALGYLDD